MGVGRITPNFQRFLPLEDDWELWFWEKPPAFGFKIRPPPFFLARGDHISSKICATFWSRKKSFRFFSSNSYRFSVLFNSHIGIFQSIFAHTRKTWFSCCLLKFGSGRKILASQFYAIFKIPFLKSAAVYFNILLISWKKTDWSLKVSKSFRGQLKRLCVAASQNFPPARSFVRHMCFTFREEESKSPNFLSMITKK